MGARFEVFDRNMVEQGLPAGPLTQVKAGRLLFNADVWAFLDLHARDGHVALLFDRALRVAAVKPADSLLEGSPGTLWRAEVMRSLEWPRRVRAPQFVEHYQVAEGVFPARLLRGPGPRMVTFPVGPPAAG